MHWIATSIIFCGLTSLSAFSPEVFESIGGKAGLITIFVYCLIGPIIMGMTRD